MAGASANPAIGNQVVAHAGVSLESGIPFVSDAELQSRLTTTDLPPATQDAVVAENASARLVALRSALSVVALEIVVALLFTRMVPDQSLAGDGPPPRDGPRRRRRHAS